MFFVHFFVILYSSTVWSVNKDYESWWAILLSGWVFACLYAKLLWHDYNSTHSWLSCEVSGQPLPLRQWFSCHLHLGCLEIRRFNNHVINWVPAIRQLKYGYCAVQGTSFNVTDVGINRKPVCDCLLVINTDILYRTVSNLGLL